MRKVAMILGLLLASLCLNAQQVFLVKQGRGRAQQGMAIHGNWIFSCEDGGKVNLYDFRKRTTMPTTPNSASRRKPGLPSPCCTSVWER